MKSNKAGTTLKELKVKKYATSAQVIEDSKGLKVIGTYTLDGWSEARGVFAMNCDFNLENIHTVLSEFDVDFLKKNEMNFSARSIEKKEKKANKKGDETRLPTIDNLKVKSVFTNSDKSFIAIAEVTHDYWDMTFVNKADGTTKTVRKHYFSKGVVCVFKFSEQGKLIWKVKIPKGQRELDWFLNAGISTVVKDRKLHILYNGHVDNYLKESNYIKSMSNTFVKGCLVMATIDLKTGSFNREMLTRYNETKQFMMPLHALVLNGAEIVFPGGSGKKQSLIKVKL